MASATNISYFAAWKAWAAHQDISMRYLWHIQVYWWGRIGTLLQLLGGMTVIASIIGPERIKGFTSNLHAHGLKQAARRLRWSVPKLWRKYKRAVTNGQGISALVSFLTAVATIFGVVVVLAGVLLGVLHVRNVTGAIAVANEIAGGLVVAVVAIPLFLLLSMMVVSGLAYALEFLIQRPLEAVAKTSARAAVVQSVGLVLLVVGTHFLLLSS